MFILIISNQLEFSVNCNERRERESEMGKIGGNGWMRIKWKAKRAKKCQLSHFAGSRKIKKLTHKQNEKWKCIESTLKSIWKIKKQDEFSFILFLFILSPLSCRSMSMKSTESNLPKMEFLFFIIFHSSLVSLTFSLSFTCTWLFPLLYKFSFLCMFSIMCR